MNINKMKRGAKNCMMQVNDRTRRMHEWEGARQKYHFLLDIQSFIFLQKKFIFGDFHVPTYFNMNNFVFRIINDQKKNSGDKKMGFWRENFGPSCPFFLYLHALLIVGSHSASRRLKKHFLLPLRRCATQ